MKSILLFIFLAFSASAFAQNAQNEINEQVWKPFIRAYDALDADAFLALHSKEVVRAPRDDGRVMAYDEYASVIASGDQNAKINKFKKKLELRFTERWVNQNLAYEVGVYKSQLIRPSGNVTVYHGRFQVVLRKENGTWKIVMDSDSSEGGTIGEKEFLSARPME
jgi:ketosteroid isomerase-like protein